MVSSANADDKPSGNDQVVVAGARTVLRLTRGLRPAATLPALALNPACLFCCCFFILRPHLPLRLSMVSTHSGVSRSTGEGNSIRAPSSTRRGPLP